MVKKRPKSRPARVSGATVTPRASCNSESIDEDMCATFNSTPVLSGSPILQKVCRLCETKDGPFLNIFDADKVIAKRINEVLPFSIKENDELPQKICFRCSAKAEELYEFILKCVKTEDNLRTSTGKKSPLLVKSKFRVQWEQHLNKKNISNDDICNALIKKAMDGIKDLPLNTLSCNEEKFEKPQIVAPISEPKNKNLKNIVEPAWKKEKEAPSLKSASHQSEGESEDGEQNDQVTLKQVKLSIEKCDRKIPARSSPSCNVNKKPETMPVPDTPQPPKVKQYPSRKLSKQQSPVENKEVSEQSNATTANNIEKPIETPPKAPEAPPPPINIMDHVSTIKVNSVGTLYLCKLCNRNFLKKEVVLAHGCAKNNVPKDKFLHNMPPRNIPKPPVTVKYIKMDKDFKKTVENRSAVQENRPVPENKPVDKQPEVKVNLHPPQNVNQKPKPRVGPASKTKQLLQQTAVQELAPQVQPPPVQESVVPGIQFPQLPSLNSRFKLVPGPNNTFNLVEDVAQIQMSVQTPQFQLVGQTPQFQMAGQASQFQIPGAVSQFQVPGTVNQFQMPVSTPQFQMAGPTQFHMTVPTNQFQMSTPVTQYQMAAQIPQFQTPTSQPPVNQPMNNVKSKSKKHKLANPPVIVPDNGPHDIIDLEESILPEPPGEQPYPVGMFTTPQHSGALAPNNPKPSPAMPASKKQSYTIVQTGNPSKLLISTKPQPAAEEQPKKKSKKKTDAEENSQSKDSGYFTFINVDPLVQPTYILPTDNIIQESQISTSTPAAQAAVEKEKDKYSCNMCEESFSREKKLLTHIQSHFNQMDKEDQLRREKSGPSSKKRTRKS